MSEKKIPCIFYLYISSKLAERSKRNVLDKKVAVSYLSQWRIPKHLRVAIMKELELLGLIEDCNCTIKVSTKKLDLNNITKVYELVGLVSLKD